MRKFKVNVSHRVFCCCCWNNGIPTNGKNIYKNGTAIRTCKKKRQWTQNIIKSIEMLNEPQNILTGFKKERKKKLPANISDIPIALQWLLSLNLSTSLI